MKINEATGLGNFWDDMSDTGIDVMDETEIEIDEDKATIILKGKGTINGNISDVSIMFEGILTIIDPYNVALYLFSKVGCKDVKEVCSKLKTRLPKYANVIQDAYERNYKELTPTL